MLCCGSGFLRRVIACMTMGCAYSPELEEVRVDVHGLDGRAPGSFRVIVALEGEVAGLSCPADEATLVAACATSGFTLARPRLGTRLTVLARGFAAAELELGEPLASSLSLSLQALPTFENSLSYRTGLDVGEGEAQFEELAVGVATELGRASMLKFYLTTGPEPSVYFANTKLYPRHFDFVRDALGQPVSARDFADATYRGASRRAFAGTLSRLSDLQFRSEALTGSLASAPVILEFLPTDDISPEQVRVVYRMLADRLLWLPQDGWEQRLFYVPAGSDHQAELEVDASAFAGREILTADQVELYADVDRQFLNPGIAYGTLRLLGPEELATAAVSLRDILVLRRVPNDIPLAGGTITEELQTPLSHVNLAAKARGTPNLALLGASSNPRIAPLIGKTVKLEVTSTGFELEEATLEEVVAFWEMRAPVALVPAIDGSLRGLPLFEDVGFQDAPRVGVKAANLGELRRLLGDRSPRGFAVPISSYDDYMSSHVITAEMCERARAACASGPMPSACEGAGARCVAGAAAQESLYAFVDRLLSDDELARDSSLRAASLGTLSFLIRNGTVMADFATALDARVAEVFGDGQVRLRSSTNVEDLPGFSGAGLYESVSAQAGGARAASMRIREVWASAWSFRAFEERAFWNVDQRRVRVGVAVNSAVDDEVANGVLVTQDLAHPGAPGLYVNVQRGEVEVANPEGGALPEVFSIVQGPQDVTQIVRQRFSSLSPGEPLLRDAEIALLAELAERVQTHFASLYETSAGALALDLEFKLLPDRFGMLIKQVRPYSNPPNL